MNGDLTLDGLDFDTLGPLSAEPMATGFRPEPVARVVHSLDVEVDADPEAPMVFAPSDTVVWASSLGVFDLETTGIDPLSARIVSAHVGVLDAAGVPVEECSWLADPGVEIPAEAAAVHGITTERARTEGRPAVEVVAEILAALRSLAERGIPVVVYNAPYDLTLLIHEAERHGHSPVADLLVVDPLVIDKAVDRYRKGKRTLGATAEFYGVELLDAHDCRADAIAAGRVAQALASRYAAELTVSIARLHEMQVEWCREQAESFALYMRRVRDPGFVAQHGWPVRDRV